MIVGTAGHIDHGKTALVKALTGVDADRLKEEKARGMTIDLGFAYLPQDDERITGFIDVPGHERFVHTMLAGASGIDLALLVIAADDGPMPQTLEHIAILDLLGIRHGMIALSKADLADAARREQVAAEIRQAVRGTSLSQAEILPVSVVTGEGLDELKAALRTAEQRIKADRYAGRFRLAVDRCFTLSGAGTVVTGTVLSGTVRVGDQLLISPSGLSARVRSIHAQNRPAEEGAAGQRCALNLSGENISKEAIRRGDTVLDALLHAPTDRIDAEVRLLASESKSLDQWFPARLHHASVEAGAHIVLLGEPVAPGTTAKVQLVLDRPIAAASGDRFVLRDASAQRTIGGGRFLDLRPPARKRRTPERLAQLDALAQPELSDQLKGLLALSPYLVDLSAFKRDHALSDEEAEELLDGVNAVTLDVDGARLVASHATWDRLKQNVLSRLQSFHHDNPDLQGIGRERLRIEIEPRLLPKAFVAALHDLAKSKVIVLTGAFVRLPEHEVHLSAQNEALWAVIMPLLGGEVRFRPPRVRDIGDVLKIEEAEVRRLLKACARLGRLDQIAHDHFFLRSTTSEMAAIAESVAEAENGEFSAAAFRDRMGNGRKVAIQILDFFDQHGLTFRRGDLRRINRRQLDLFAPVPVEGNSGRESSLVGRPDFKSGWGSETVSGGFDSRSLPPVSEQTGSEQTVSEKSGSARPRRISKTG